MTIKKEKTNLAKGMEIDKKEALKLNKELNKKRKTMIKIKKEADEGLEEERKNIERSSLKDVYDVTEKWLGIRLKDRNRIDIILATVLSNQILGTPIWLFIVGASGDWKTAFCSALEGLKNVIKIDQMTKNTLASGQKDVEDLGSRLHNASTILLFLDLASLTSANNDEKNQIWGQYRTLYDGDIYKVTGSGVNKKYEKCHVTMIACTTPSIRNEILIFAQLGTRELMYDTEADPIDNDFKMDKAIANERYEEQMKEELCEVVKNFIIYHKVKEIEISEENIKFLKSEASRLTVLRASGTVDRVYKELINPIDPEVPSRLIKQFIRIWRCLKSLDDDYPDEKAKKIITHIVNSSGDKIRQMVLALLRNNPDKEFKIPDVQEHTRLGRKSIKGQLEMLWNLRILEKSVKIERIGGTIDAGYNGQEIRMVGGKIEEIPYYRYSKENPAFSDQSALQI